jgi:hypothetical protein
MPKTHNIKFDLIRIDLIYGRETNANQPHMNLEPKPNDVQMRN